MRIEFDGITISGLRDFGADQSTDVPQNTIVSIIGHNKDDGGSNGTGKSTFAMSVPVNLYGPTAVGISTKSLKNRHMSIPVRLVGRYKIDGMPLIVDRTLGGKFTFKYGENEWEDGKSEDVQEKLNTILKLTPDQLQFLSNRPQGEIGGFLLMKDTEKKDFLSSFFEVNFVSDAKEKASLMIKTTEQQIAITTGKLQMLESQRDRLTSSLVSDENRLQQYTSESFMSSIAALEEKIKSLDGYHNGLNEILNSPEALESYVDQTPSVKELREKNNAQVAELNAKNTEIGHDHEKYTIEVNALQQELSVPTPVPATMLTKQNEVLAAIMQIKARKLEKGSITQKITKIDWELESIRKKHQDSESSSCASCGTKLSDEKITKIKQDLALSAKPLLEQKIALTNQDKDLVIEDGTEEKLEAEKMQISNEISQFKLSNSKAAIEEKLRSLKSSQAALVSAQQANNRTIFVLIDSVKTEIASVRRTLLLNKENVASEIRTAKMEIEGKLRDKQAAEKSVADAKVALETAVNELAVAKSGKESNESELAILQHVDKITSRNGFIGYLFDSILEDINFEINKNLKMIPNAQKFSLQLNSDKVAKTTGTVSKSITYQIFSGKDEVEFNTLSGGEKLSVIIAVDEAVDTVKSRRLGVSIGWKFLDEQFSWIDENSKEAILEFYKLKSINKTYFVIDHASEFNAALETKISIVKENGIAKFTEAS